MRLQTAESYYQFVEFSALWLHVHLTHDRNFSMASLITNYHCYNQIFNSFGKLLVAPDFTDVTLVTEDGEYFPAHISVLQSHNTIFKSLLSESKLCCSQPNQIIFLPEICAEDLKSILELFYTGNCFTSKTQLRTLMVSLKVLQFEESEITVEGHSEDNFEDSRGIDDTEDTTEIEKTEYVENTAEIEEMEDTEETDKIEETEETERREETKGHYIIESKSFDDTSAFKTIGRTENKINVERYKLEIKTIKLLHDEPFSCTLCLGVFKTNNSRKRHMDTVHGIAKFRCALCGNAYKRKDILQKHMSKKHGICKLQKSETYLQMFECDRCIRSFQMEEDLRSHKKYKHKITKEKNNSLHQNSELSQTEF